MPQKNASIVKKRVVEYAIRFTLIIASILMIELVSFLYIKIRAVPADTATLDFHVYDPYRAHRLNPQFIEPTLQKRIHSEDGFRRDAPISVRKKEGTVRIIALGGSALYGLGSGGVYPFHPILDNDETITHFLEKRIGEQFENDGIEKEVEVINAGVIGYCTFQHLVYLNSVLLEYEPDWVINIDGHNDFYSADPSARPWMDYDYSSTRLLQWFNERDFYISLHAAIRSFAPSSYTFTILEMQSKKVVQRMTEKSILNKETREEPAKSLAGFQAYAKKSFIRSLWQVCRLGEIEGYRHCVFLQPEVVFEDEAVLTPHDRNIKKITIEHGSEIEREYREALPALFGERDIPFYDFGEIGDRNPDRADLYLDYCHLTPDGGRVLAEAIFEVLYPQLME